MLVYRVNWLRAKSRRDRWAEEEALLVAELQWTRRFHGHRKELWQRRADGTAIDNSGTPSHPEFQCYALKQAKTWSLLESHATNALCQVVDLYDIDP